MGFTSQPLLVTQHPAQGDDGLIGLMVRIPAGFVLAEAITSVDPFGQAFASAPSSGQQPPIWGGRSWAWV